MYGSTGVPKLTWQWNPHAFKIKYILFIWTVPPKFVTCFAMCYQSVLLDVRKKSPNHLQHTPSGLTHHSESEPGFFGPWKWIILGIHPTTQTITAPSRGSQSSRWIPGATWVVVGWQSPQLHSNVLHPEVVLPISKAPGRDEQRYLCQKLTVYKTKFFLFTVPSCCLILKKMKCINVFIKFLGFLAKSWDCVGYGFLGLDPNSLFNKVGVDTQGALSKWKRLTSKHIPNMQIQADSIYFHSASWVMLDHISPKPGDATLKWWAIFGGKKNPEIPDSHLSGVLCRAVCLQPSCIGPAFFGVKRFKTVFCSASFRGFLKWEIPHNSEASFRGFRWVWWRLTCILHHITFGVVASER